MLWVWASSSGFWAKPRCLCKQLSTLRAAPGIGVEAAEQHSEHARQALQQEQSEQAFWLTGASTTILLSLIRILSGLLIIILIMVSSSTRYNMHQGHLLAATSRYIYS